MNLYEILGVPKDVSKDRIKKAYRRKAAEMHPDKGGDPAMFRELAMAYGILFDEEKRARYDSGESADSINQIKISEDQEAYQALVTIFNELVRSMDIQFADIAGEIRKNLKFQIDRMNNGIKMHKSQVERLEQTEKRFKSTGKENIFSMAIKAQIGGINRHIEETERQIRIGELGLEKMESYSYEFDERPNREQQFGSIFGF
jgi:curved DNA-binding protein CbpA